ncbi:hypothetical protein Taro_053601 [Colocasia esculenta]|uniref:Uncharacterized protein n=1 Tax=Colocasia esculenta TaxID=4460 RepID=A0A843XNA8_COLES|nr:hypothetical protein [Colocasia esculenta]
MGGEGEEHSNPHHLTSRFPDTGLYEPAGQEKNRVALQRTYDLYTSSTDNRTYDLCTSTTDSRTYDLYTSTTDNRTYDLCTSTTDSRTHDLCTSTTGGSIGPTASASPSQMASGSTPPPSDPVHTDDETSHHEGEGSYSEMMRAVWINEEYDLLYDMFMRNHRFIECSDESCARSAWTTTARANFKHLLYNVRRNAERVCASTDTNQWREHRPV